MRGSGAPGYAPGAGGYTGAFWGGPITPLSKTRVAGRPVIISGCGPIGLMAVADSQCPGSRPHCGRGPSHAAQAEMARRLGADFVASPQGAEIAEAVEQAGGGYGMAVGIELAGTPESAPCGI